MMTLTLKSVILTSFVNHETTYDLNVENDTNVYGFSEFFKHPIISIYYLTLDPLYNRGVGIRP